MTDRYISQFPKPTAFEREILVNAAEECVEVVQRITKLLRFGAQEKQKGQELTNVERLSEEYGNLITTARCMFNLGLLSEADVLRGAEHKRASLQKYLQSTPPEGFKI
jgi:hypothetical protein